MAVEDWYQYKAQQCRRLGDLATDPGKRRALLEESEVWLGIASDIARQAREEARRMEGVQPTRAAAGHNR